MKKDWLLLIVVAVCIAVVMPWSVMRWHKETANKEDIQIRVLTPDGEVLNLPLEEYILGVVAAEMPAEFELEALKAQAVAARTYAVKRMTDNVSTQKGYDVDTTVQTQAWLSDEEMKENWGLLNYWRYKHKLQRVVDETKGMVMEFQGEYIEAFYHSSSGRKPTEKAEDVWSSSRQYLKNVSSEEDRTDRYVEKKTYTPQELYNKLGVDKSVEVLTPEDFRVLEWTSVGRAKRIKVLGKVFTGVQLRSLLGLKSSDIEWDISSGCLTITTYGNGHGVGMSQWGANDLAKKHKNVKEILAHFYPGTELKRINTMQ